MPKKVMSAIFKVFEMVKPFLGNGNSAGQSVLQNSTRREEVMQKSTRSLFQFQNKGGGENQRKR
jgi:hypothetical protein